LAAKFRIDVAGPIFYLNISQLTSCGIEEAIKPYDDVKNTLLFESRNTEELKFKQLNAEATWLSHMAFYSRMTRARTFDVSLPISENF